MNTLLECGHHYTPGNYTTGYGVNRDDGSKLCAACCAQLDLVHMAQAQNVVSYLSSDGKTITGWPGYKLATVYRERESRHNIGGKLTRVWCLDDMGQWWHGTTPGRSMYVRLRLSKPETAKHARRYPEHTATWETRKALRAH